MRGAVELRTDGCTDLQMDSNKQYIVTKWYGSSLAIFEEAAFQKYLRRLDTDFKDNGHGPLFSVSGRYHDDRRIRWMAYSAGASDVH